jgi:hypothetical protein
MLMLMQMQYNYGAKHQRCYSQYLDPRWDHFLPESIVL